MIKNANEMSAEELKAFRNSFNPDEMGGLEIEGIDEQFEDKTVQIRNMKLSDSDISINQYLTLINYTDANRTKDKIKHVVIHYVGSTGSALGNCNFFYNTYRGASANYFVGFNGEIYQCVKDEDIAWQCGGGLQGSNGHTFFKICTNSNSIGIEMCVRNYGSKASTSSEWYFEDATVEGTIKLVKYLMEKYNIDADHVIRHYDVSGKFCPNPYVRDESAWIEFKNKLKISNIDTYKTDIQSQANIGDDAVNHMLAYTYKDDLFKKLHEGMINKKYKSWYVGLTIDINNAKKILSLIGLSDITINYLLSYKWGNDLVIKLAKIMI